MSDSERGFTDFGWIKGMDPGANWLLGPGFGAFAGEAGEAARIPFILMTSSEALIEFLSRGNAGGGLDILTVQPSGTGVTLAIGWVTPARLGLLLRDRAQFANAPKCIQLGLPLPPRLFVPEPRPEPPVSARGRWPGAVVVGVIDDGIAIGNERFRYKNGKSRFEYFWRQDTDPPSKGGTVPYGREYGKAEIDQALQQCGGPTALAEDRFYRHLGLADFGRAGHKSVAWRLAHGTHVLDLAAGYPSERNRDDRPLIGVQLPVASTAGQSGSGLEPYVLYAIWYILDRAARLTPDHPGQLPVVINFSYGTYAGPHNGKSAFERGIDLLVENARQTQRTVRVVMPAGNSNLARCHEQFSFKERCKTHELHLRVQPDGQTVTTVQIWVPGRPNGARVRLRVIAPDGRESCWIDEVRWNPCPRDCGTAPCTQFSLPVQVPFNAPPKPGCIPDPRLYCVGTYTDDCCAERGVFRINIGPTAHVADLAGSMPKVLAPSGLWRIEVENIKLRPGDELNAWIERNDLLYGYPRRGRQAYFDERSYERFDRQGRRVTEDTAQPPSPERRTGLLSGIATGREPLVVGGFNRKDHTVADYSAFGPVLESQPAASPRLFRPDAVAVSDDSRIHLGVFAAGSRSGTRVAMRGTSVAAPQVTRWVAEELANNRPGDWNALRDAARQSEKKHPHWPHLPGQRGGRGRLSDADPAPRPRQRFWV